MSLNDPIPSRTVRNRLKALHAIASPARQELISLIAEGATTVQELSQRLGRSRQALYYHLDALEKAGLIRVAGTKGEGRERERIYERAPGPTDLRGQQFNASEMNAAAKATKAMLRLTQREILDAIEDAASKQARGGQACEGYGAMIAIRAKARLDRKSLEKVNELLSEITGIFRGAKGKNADQKLMSFTVVFTPSREAGTNSGTGSRKQGKTT